jgi:hypothetical protein
MPLRLVTATLAAALLTGCSVTVAAPSDPASTPAATVASASTPASTPAATGRTWTHQLVDTATRPAGATSAQVKGGTTTYPNSTSLWVGCDGLTDEVTLGLDGRYQRLFGHLGLRSSAPAGLVVHVLVLVDGKPVQNVQLDSDKPAPVEVNAVLTDALIVTFESKAVKGSCGEAAESYAVLGDGYVE